MALVAAGPTQLQCLQAWGAPQPTTLKNTSLSHVPTHCFGLQHHLEQILPSVLHGLADETDGVRGAALAAGRTMVELYADSALPLLLPAVEEGIINDNWRIRQSSAELMGDLLFKVPFCRSCRCDARSVG